MTTERRLFFELWLKRPLDIAAVTPSGMTLADTMAGLVDLSWPGPVLELGAGTGSITRGLMRAGCPPERLIVLEREQQLVTLLRTRHPGLSVICGDASDIDLHLRSAGVTRLCAVVSSLPIKWFSEEAQRAIVLPCLRRLGPDGLFLQMTNAFASPVMAEHLGIAGSEVARIWLNLPPAQIWAYRQRGGPQRPGSTVGKGRPIPMRSPMPTQ